MFTLRYASDDHPVDAAAPRSWKNDRERWPSLGDFVGHRLPLTLSSNSDAPVADHSARICCLRWAVAITKASFYFGPSRLGNMTFTSITGNLT